MDAAAVTSLNMEPGTKVAEVNLLIYTPSSGEEISSSVKARLAPVVILLSLSPVMCIRAFLMEALSLNIMPSYVFCIRSVPFASYNVPLERSPSL